MIAISDDKPLLYERLRLRGKQPLQRINANVGASENFKQQSFDKLVEAIGVLCE
jgi:hypothetical protein